MKNLSLLFIVFLLLQLTSFAQNPEWVVYDTTNSGLPVNGAFCITIDGSDNKWIGTIGLAMFDGSNWTVYDTSNSGLPDNEVRCIAIDGSDNKWIGTGSMHHGAGPGGLAMFDGSNWMVYDTSNSGLPFNHISSITIDGSGNKWIATWWGLAMFDGST